MSISSSIPPPSISLPWSCLILFLFFVQIFATYEWCLTPKYNANDETHRLIKKKIEEGDGLPDMATQEECVQALRDVGFEVRRPNQPTSLPQKKQPRGRS
jgi:hypothetical protein